jgi:LysM repeat protein
MTDEFRPEEDFAPSQDQSVDWGQPAGHRRRRSWGSIFAWLIGAILVLVVATGAGLGAAYLIAQTNAAPTPRTALPDPTPTAAAPTTPAPTTSPSPPQGTPATGTPEPMVTGPIGSPAVEATPREHIVARGESISLIAAEYGVSMEEIIELNDLRNPNRIVPGQRLLIPPP